MRTIPNGYYALDASDIANGKHRERKGERCYIPTRSDVGPIKGLLSFGSPNCYEIIEQDGKTYGVPKEY